MKKRGSILLVVVLMLSAILAACGGSSGSADDKEVTIEFMHSSVEKERLDVIKELVAKFEKENPNIKVKQVPVEEDAFNTKVVTLARSGKLPAVLEVSQDFAKVMDKDKLIDQAAIKDVIKEVGEDSYYEGALNLVRSEDGKSYIGVPLTGWVQGIWYDKKALAAANFEEPKNWNDILTIAKHFTNKANKKYGIAIPTAEGAMAEQAFSQFALSNEANVLDAKGNITIDTKEMKQALTFYQELAKYTMPGSNDVTEIKDAFMNGTAPMAMYSTYILPAVFTDGDPSNVGFIIPEEKEKAVYGTVSALALSDGLDDAQKDAGKKFVEFLSQPENQTKWVLMSPGGAQPVNKGVIENEAYKNNEVVKSFGALSEEIAKSFDDIQIFGLVDGKNFTKMGDITSSGVIAKMVNNVTVGGKDVESELEKAQSTAESNN
ncbi:sugar ABC transporter substrate-binding protein [Listeria newyorkensis]|uniref:Sugar ABC transporter substrate-binding protein n=2 Tax=Listeria newyorkensis TaxID=1497681 RepID=A0ABX4XQL6_9LIST|nr:MULTISPECIES: sugar ABC transporter substrate-binding protein [Listeria]KGL42063.1 sugar ABC transporter substrate-binding protein [Listeriaceae bacterium FSL A5-0209]KGL46132.1 sugar ABC transporter substrate-binding protein [Listeria newyorkensis]KMT62928.1 putative ABC transporter periplasmic-binding protein ycjN [Listeria newyorkensis]PNP94448.1 sugar ABC transporter substrate-binding protein [Listeria newyorkensis]RQW67584.1 sugar ABC transporter substrate-binding protein [Listeria sp.